MSNYRMLTTSKTVSKQKLKLRLSMDLKVEPRSLRGYKFILCAIDEVSNYLIVVILLFVVAFVGRIFQ